MLIHLIFSYSSYFIVFVLFYSKNIVLDTNAYLLRPPVVRVPSGGVPLSSGCVLLTSGCVRWRSSFTVHRSPSHVLRSTFTVPHSPFHVHRYTVPSSSFPVHRTNFKFNFLFNENDELWTLHGNDERWTRNGECGTGNVSGRSRSQPEAKWNASGYQWNAAGC